MGTKIIFTQKYAKELEKRGHKLLEIQPNKKNTKLNVFIFEHTPQLDLDFIAVQEELSTKAKEKSSQPNQKKKNVTVVFTPYVASRLVELGYTLIKTEPNFTNPALQVYLFKRERGIVEDIKNITREKAQLG